MWSSRAVRGTVLLRGIAVGNLRHAGRGAQPLTVKVGWL
jgi:hypothetical protein